jgi:cell surface protein SprA
LVRIAKYTFQVLFLLCLLFIVWASSATFILHSKVYKKSVSPIDIADDTMKDDTSNLIYPISHGYNYPFNGSMDSSALYLHNPPNISDSIIYDPETNSYIFTNTVGGHDITPPNSMSFEDYQNYDIDKSMREYWRERNGSSTGKSGIPKIHIGGEAFDQIFGSNTIDIRPQGSAELIFGLQAMRRQDPALNVKQQKTANFNFQEKIQMNVTAKIGDKISLGMSYNTEATFDFENKMKLAYEGKEDDIIKSIEAGDVTLPLNSTLITGSQSLFGLKTKLQFGKTTVTSVFSQQKSQTSTINVSGGAQTSKFNFKADQYEENKHFFIAQYFRNRYDVALKDIPVVNSNINITKIEVWVTNIGAATTDNRNIVAFTDLGEYTPYNRHILRTPPSISYPSPQHPSNRSNNLYHVLIPSYNANSPLRNINTATSYLTSNLSSYNFVASQDYEIVNLARKLLPTEYTFNSKLGFISLNSTLNANQVLAVAYQYTIIGDTTVYQVGDLSSSIAGPNALVVKLIKSSQLNTRIPIWNLMMKNVYSIGGYQINKDEFRLDVLYTSGQNGVPMGYFTEGNNNVKGLPIIRLLNCDNLDIELDPEPDGVFDFIDNAATTGGTIQASNGRIYFPVLEPFGSDLRARFNDNALADKYCYDSLYTMTKTGAQQYPEKNRFTIQGMYKSAGGSEISLNAMNVPQGSVKVTAGGILLTENVDYTVDYTLGRVKIINEGILNSGTPIQITLENNSLFNIQTKTLMGTHIDQTVNKNLTLGATILNLTEKPITQKVNYGDEPISNTIWGINGNYQKESLFITKMLNELPFYSSKTPSKVAVTGEFADLIPGHAKAIGKTGTSYIDDFEGSISTIDLKNVGTWHIASTPQGQTSANMFPEGAPNTGLAYRYNVARFCWYVIDPLFQVSNNLTPSNITKNDQSNNYTRQVLQTEVFPNEENPDGVPTPIPVLNLAFYPKQRGVYNYDAAPDSIYSKGVANDGTLNNPETRWGGMMRNIETTDFVATNVQYIQFWLMDPFVNPGSGETNFQQLQYGGDLYFDLGNLSEDILRDGQNSEENGLPTTSTVTNVDTTKWGRVPTLQALTNSFANDPNSRQYQDVGIDGLGDADERSFFVPFVQNVNTLCSSNPTAQGVVEANTDPSSDDYHYFRGTDYDNNNVSILDRYRKFNGLEGNSVASGQATPGADVESYPVQATTIPDGEDINHDNTVNQSEMYFQYKVSLRPSQMVVGQNFITDMYEAQGVSLANGSTTTVKWYQFKIPIESYVQAVGNIQDFTSIGFMRMFLKGFTENTILRFATLDLVRGDWRKYDYSLLTPGEYIPNGNISNTTFDLSVVNIFENGTQTPVPYVMPPGIQQEVNLETTNLQKLNEQSMSISVCNLLDGDSRAVYKTCNFDMRQYKNLNMFVHEQAGSTKALNKGDLTIFLRLGTDFTQNYYEYEIPLTPTPWGTSATNVDAIWPDSNMFNITLSILENAKMARNTQMRTSGSNVSLTTPYVTYDHGRKITVMGTPTLSAVQVIMIGIRNPKKSSLNPYDDGLPKCAVIWVDELRLTDFNKKGGWAATSTANVTLADLGNATIAGKIVTPGFGGIEQKINDLSKATTMQYEFATSLELGKFLPEKSGIKIPMHFDYSQIISNPQYDPLDPDVLYKDALNSYTNKAQKDSLKSICQDITTMKSLNFVNVKKNKTKTSSKSHFYDVENFDFTYSFKEKTHSDVDIQHNLTKEYFGAIGYNFNNSPKNYVPLSKVKFLSYGPLKLIKDFNFYLMPKTLTFRTDMDRLYSEEKLRNLTNADIIIDTTFVKSFTWKRDYGLKFDFTKNLTLDYTANADARIDEPQGRIDNGEKRDSIWNNIKNFGRMTNYNHTLDVNYNIPINKISWFNWVTASAKYNAGYIWTGAPLSALAMGNTIENSNTKQLNGSFNFINLYNKVGYLKKLNQQKASNTSSSNSNTNKTPDTKSNNKNKSQNTNNKNKNKNNKSDSTEADTTSVDIVKAIKDNVLKFLMGVKNVSFSYSKGNGTFIPGYMLTPEFIGMDATGKYPGTGFVFGDQTDIRPRFGNNTSFLSTDSSMNYPYATKFTENFTARATIEPVSKFMIELSATRTFLDNHSEYYKWNNDSLRYMHYNPTETGAYSVSILSFRTMFSKDNKATNSNVVFAKFQEYLQVIAYRLANKNKNWIANGSHSYIDSTSQKKFPVGYGPTDQDVMLPAFLAAYTGTGKNPNSVSLTPFSEKLSWKDIPMPNWKINYDGLTKIPFIHEYLKTLTLSNSYKSTYSVGSFSSNVLYDDKNGDGLPDIRDQLSNNYIPLYQIDAVTISEQFSPLIGFDMTWNNSLLSDFKINKTRNISLCFDDNQLTEVTSDEYIVGLGYKIKNVVLPIKLGTGKTKKLKSDLNFKADVSFKTNKTVLRQLVQDINEVSAGQRIISINISADYMISQKFTIKLFFDKTINNPFVSNQFPNSNTNAGISLKFSLAQ